MKPFNHINATSIAEATQRMSDAGTRASFIAGGTDLLGVLKERILPNYPELIINLKSIPGLNYIKEEGGVLKIGALTSLATIAESSVVNDKYFCLSESARKVSSPTLRFMGTLGGNICQDVRCWYYRYPNNIGGRIHCFRKGGNLCYALTGDNRYHAIFGGAGCFAVCPSDTAISLTALGATIVTNKRSVPISDFYAVLGNVLSSDEIVTEIQIPTPATNTKQSFIKYATRKSIDFSIVSVATIVNSSEAKIVLGGVAPVPYRATAAEDIIKGNTITEALAEEAGGAATKNAIPLPNNKYKIQLVRTIVKRSLLS